MWVQTEEKAIGALGKFFDMAYTAQMLWRSEDYDERLREEYSRLIGGCILPRLRELLHGTYPRIPRVEVSLPLPHGDTVLPQRLSSLKGHGVISNSFTVEVSQKLRRLVFVHATIGTMPRVSWLDILKTGEYSISYSDGSSETVELGYGTEILTYDRAYAEPLADPYYRHYGYMGTWFADPVFMGKLNDGRDLTLYSLPWDNPHPQKTIVSVSYRSDLNSPTSLLLYELRGEPID